MNTNKVNFKKMGFKPLVCTTVFCLLLSVSFAQNPNGTIGNLTWELNLSDSTLTISGNDTMPDYSGVLPSDNPPWRTMYSSIAKVVINEGVKSIGNLAFGWCSNVTSVSIPNSVTRIGESAFCGNSFTSLPILPSSVTEIEGGTFYVCNKLTSVTIPNTITKIGHGAFARCDSLRFVNIGNSVTAIGATAFQICKSLRFVSIGSSVDSIGQSAFNGCRLLDSIICNANIPPACRNYISAFYDVPKTIPVYVPCGSISAYQMAGDWKEFINYQVIGYPLNSFPVTENVTVTQKDSVIEINWQSTNALRYEVYRNNTLLTTTTATTYTDTGNLTNGTNYCYKIKAIYELCESGYSKDTCKKYEYNKPVGIHNYELGITNYVLYPNPTNSQLRIKNYELRENEVIEIYDVVGRLQYIHRHCGLDPQSPANNALNNEIAGQARNDDRGISIDVSHLENGIYFVTFYSEGQKITKKLVKY